MSTASAPPQAASAHPLADRTRRIAMSATSAILSEATRLRAAGHTLYDFGVGEPDFSTPEHILEAGIEAMQQGFTKYTPVGGLPEARAAIARAHARDFGSSYAPDEVGVTVGGKQALFNAISVVIDHGDEVILPAPYWVSFRDQVQYAGGRPVIVPTAFDNAYALSPAAVEAALTPRTRAIICNSPSNPSGAVMPPETFRALLDICRRRGIWMISDECYAKFVYDAPPYSAASEPNSKDWLIVAGSLSKAYVMTGWRVGYALAPARIISAMIDLQSHSTSCVAGFTQKAAMAALEGTQAPVARMLAEYRRRRDAIVAGLRSIPGIECVTPSGAFYAYPRITGLLGGDAAAKPGGQRPATSLEFSTRLLREAGVVTVPAEAFGGAGNLRFSYATSMEVIEQGLQRLAPFCAGLLH